MAFDDTGFFTIVGKYVKLANVIDGYFAAVETTKNEIRDAYEAVNLNRIYATLPDVIDSLYNDLTSWISTLRGDLDTFLVNQEYVLEQLPIYGTGTDDVLDGLRRWMETNSKTIEETVTYLGGSDVNQECTDNAPNQQIYPRLFVTRITDGAQSPVTGAAISQYNYGLGDMEGQLVAPTTHYFEVVDVSAGWNTATAQLFSTSPAAQLPYTKYTEDPGTGPVLLNVNATSSGVTDGTFQNWTGDEPDDWTVSGTVTTDYGDKSGTGVGPLQLKNVGITAKQAITGLTTIPSTMYFWGAWCKVVGDSSGDTVTARIQGGTDADPDQFFIQDFTFTLSGSVTYSFPIYGMMVPFASVPSVDPYIRVELEARSAGTHVLEVHNVIVSPVTYFNGLGFAFWIPEDTTWAIAPGYTGSLAITHNATGVFQDYFRKNYQFQLPNDPSPTYADTLAT